MGISGVQYSGSYGDNLFDTRSTRAAPVDNDTDFALSVAHTDLGYSAYKHNNIMAKGRTRKQSVMMHWVFEFIYSIYCATSTEKKIIRRCKHNKGSRVLR